MYELAVYRVVEKRIEDNSKIFLLIINMLQHTFKGVLREVIPKLSFLPLLTVSTVSM